MSAAKKAEVLAAAREGKGEDKEPTGTHNDYDIDMGIFHDDDGKVYVRKDSKGVRQISGRLGVSKEEAVETAKAVHNYTYKHDREMRDNEMRGIKDPRVDRVNRLLDKSPKYNGDISRGLYFKSEQEAQAFIAQIKSGGFETRAMASFSSDPRVALAFSSRKKNPQPGDEVKGVHLTVKNKSGVSIRNFSGFKEEQEVLVPGGTKYRFKGEAKNEYSYFLKLEEV